VAVALERRGYRITALVARTRAHARRAARLLAARPLALGADALDQLPASDLLIVAVPDDEIAPTAALLSARLRTGARARVGVALHTSGALASDVLAPLRARGFSAGSLHPLVSVADAASGADALRGAFFCVEGEARAARAARRIVRDLGGRSFSVAAEDRALYHAAAVFAAGHAVALFDVATQLLARCGVRGKLARRALLPLAASALKNLARAPSNARALTGPFARRDLETVRRHIAALDARRLGAELRLYLLLGLRALSTASAGGDRAADAARIAAEIQRALAKLDENRAGIVDEDDD
ncbi:MAG: DUF2520 domain-containing protein, partial [Acidobacteria bacterium]|nr:DUF2520 domain-containing protein [Acidobacteriota bacterium]